MVAQLVWQYYDCTKIFFVSKLKFKLKGRSVPHNKRSYLSLNTQYFYKFYVSSTFNFYVFLHAIYHSQTRKKFHLVVVSESRYLRLYKSIHYDITTHSI